jgi:hypothetical protein
MTSEHMDSLAPQVVRAALGLSQRIGYRGADVATDSSPVLPRDLS